MSARGPRSRSGRAAVASNSLVHGLTADAIVLESESEEEWTKFLGEVTAQLGVDGPVEAALASRVAELLWRLRRVTRAEVQMVSVAQTCRDTIVYDRSLTESAVDYDAEPDGPERLRAKRKEFGKTLSIYARAEIVRGVAERYEETLPVLLPDSGGLDKIMRYEAHLNRLLRHALHELEALQDRRRGNATPLARIDIG